MPENQNEEYKESWRDEYLKWICAFANAQGGRLFIGIKDDGSVKGLSDAKKLMEEIPNKIVNLLGIVCDVDLLQKDGLEYIRITVPAYSVPIAYKGVYHIRSGSTKQELTGPALQDFLFRKMGLSWDDAVYASAPIEFIDEKAIEYFIKAGIRSGRMPESALNDDVRTVLEKLNLLSDEGNLKNAAILIFGKNPAKYFACTEFKIGRFGADDTDLIFQDVIDGNIIQMAEKVINTLKTKYLKSPIHYEGLQRIETLEIPEAALREAIFNAIIHRNYSGSFIQMKVWNDRIELWNDGELPYGVTQEDLKSGHRSKPRNKNIANVFYKAGFVESWGRGIQKICAQFKAEGLPEPAVENFCGGVNMIIPRNNPDVEDYSEAYIHYFGERKPTAALVTGENDTLELSSGDTLEEKILEVLKENPKILQTEIAEKLNVSQITVKRQMKALAASGKIKRENGKRFGSWKITSTDR